MLWQQYVDESLLGSGCVHKAGIYSNTDGNVWAQKGLDGVTPAEVKKLVSGISDSSQFQQSGIIIGGTKYMFVRSLERSAYGRKGGDSGCCIVKTNKAIIIGIYGDGVQPGQCNTVVEKLGDFLTDSGY